MDDAKGSTKLFSPVHLDLECVLFFKTRSPIDPVDFVHRICKEIVSKPGIRRMRYANRLTPVTIIGKATEKGLEELGKTVLAAHFRLSGEEGKEESAEGPQKSTPYSVSISFILEAVKLDCSRAAHGHRSSLSCGATAPIFLLRNW